MKEMKFIQSSSEAVIAQDVNIALNEGFEYLETQYVTTPSYPCILVIMVK